MTDEEFDALDATLPADDEWGVHFRQTHTRHQHTPGRPGALDGDMTIEAVPSWYAGITFRSKLEADWAATLDQWGIRWEYEPETISLPSGVNYIPDFWLPELGTWLEVKGTGVPRIEKAIELGKARACHCEGDCACQWPGGEYVLIGHPPTGYNPWADHDPETDHRAWWAVERAGWNHHGHPNWSASTGHTAWLINCAHCRRRGWFVCGTRASIHCRVCKRPPGEGVAYNPGAPELSFINSRGQVAPRRNNSPA